MVIQIRCGEFRDAATIAEFNSRMAWETERKRLDPETVRRGVERVFDDPRKGFYVVAEVDGLVVGQLMVTYEWSDWRDGWIWWIQSVYVAESRRGCGIFRHIHTHLRDLAMADRDVVGLRLYVENQNLAAQATYRKLGMEDADYRVFEEIFDRPAACAESR
jgi:ribosomal protein S18 acetylase RimI-like enzyme